MADPDLSLVMAAYDDAPGVRRHLDTLARASVPVELVLVDDASTDGLAGMLAETAPPANVELRVHRNEVNRGPGPSRNTGLAMARRGHVMFLDADDLLAPGFFDYLALSPLRNGADFVLFKYHLAPDPENRFSYDMHETDNRFFSTLPASTFPATTFRLSELPAAPRTVNFPWNKVYRRDFLDRAGIVFPDMRMHEDIRPCWQSFLRAERFGVLDWAPPLVHHFVAPGGARATNYTGPERLAAFDTLREVLAEVAAHPLAALLAPELRAFAADLAGWMCAAAAPDRARRYRTAADALLAEIDAASGAASGAAPGAAPAGRD